MESLQGMAQSNDEMLEESEVTGLAMRSLGQNIKLCRMPPFPTTTMYIWEVHYGCGFDRSEIKMSMHVSSSDMYRSTWWEATHPYPLF